MVDIEAVIERIRKDKEDEEYSNYLDFIQK